ncbi:Putative Cystinosin [Rhizopus microsporus]|nr:Putative Cystinosin [Rhizopus microsporus]
MWIDLMYYLSYVKLLVSLIKYIPQAWVNFKRKSTLGWSIHNILLDFTGGTLSITQLLLDASISGDWSGVSGDPVKLGLGAQSIAFDIIFMLQHFVWYRDNPQDAEQQELLKAHQEEQV